MRRVRAGALAGLIWIASVAAHAAIDPGELAFQYCFSCHSVDPADKTLPGPNLFGVLCRRPAAVKGFAYSDAMKAFARENRLWTPELLEQYLTDPEEIIPGTPMSLPPQATTPDARRDVIAYLRKHSGNSARACPK